MILVTPTWHTQPWYPELLRMSMGNPILLPKTPLLLKNPVGETHPLVKNDTLQLAAWIISGKNCVTQAYQKQLPNLSQNVADPHLQKNYESAWKKWVGWCAGREIDPFQCDINSIINYLAFLFQEGYEYRTICLHRSAISAYHDSVDGKQIGENWCGTSQGSH